MGDFRRGDIGTCDQLENISSDLYTGNLGSIGIKVRMARRGCMVVRHRHPDNSVDHQRTPVGNVRTVSPFWETELTSQMGTTFPRSYFLIPPNQTRSSTQLLAILLPHLQLAFPFLYEIIYRRLPTTGQNHSSPLDVLPSADDTSHSGRLETPKGNRNRRDNVLPNSHFRHLQ